MTKSGEELARIVVDCGFHLHKEVGPGLLESVYEKVFANRLTRLGLSVETQKSIPIKIDDLSFADGFRADLLIENRLLVEIKSVEKMSPVHIKQVLSYLRLMQLPLGLLINFGAETFRDGTTRVMNNRAN
ncbi:MAG: GxxExxY protein [Sphingomonadaceae bacterium]|nr:GxxExxY protein [Sphingomonadaceae bacterium]